MDTTHATRIAELTDRIRASAWPSTLAKNIIVAMFGHPRAAEPGFRLHRGQPELR